MRKSVIVILVIVVVLFVVGVFYLNARQQLETGYREGLQMGYLYGFNDARDGKPFNEDGIKTPVPVEDNSVFSKVFLAAAREGYRKGYTSGKETPSWSFDNGEDLTKRLNAD